MDAPFQNAARAVPIEGNLIVVAGAGTGKTYKLVQTCVQRLREGVGIDEVLIVTFTKAAAAELRNRIGAALQKAFLEEPDSAHLARQIALLDRAPISTLHSFCLELVSRHFSELGLSPRLMTLEPAQAAVLESEALEALFESYYEAKTPRAQTARKLLLEWFRGDEGEVRAIIRKLHVFTRTRPNPSKWFAEQRAFLNEAEPKRWREWHGRAVREWVERWRPVIAAQPDEKNPARSAVLKLLDKLDVAEIARVPEVADLWPRGTVGRYRTPLKRFYDEAAMLAGWNAAADSDPLAEDWKWIRGTIAGLLDIAEDFGREFASLKRERGLVDFADLEQFSLHLLWDDAANAPGPGAGFWRDRFKWIFVDEYQDINRAQDRIIEALARPAERGNRFLVGDVKQSIYGFRQAEPALFLNYKKDWDGGKGGASEYLVDNWRSHERLLDFVNGLFAGVMSERAGGVNYDEQARLRFAVDEKRMQWAAQADPAARVEVHMVQVEGGDLIEEEDEEHSENALSDLGRAEAEAEVLARLFQEMVEKKRATYGDMVILIRSAASEVEAFAKVFSRRGIPFDARRTGFFNCIEVLDLTNLLTILDNPLQDIPLLGVLRSPLACFSPEDLARIRMGLPNGAFWNALRKFSEEGKGEAVEKARLFLSRYQRWRDLARHTSLAQRLEIILEESGYADWIAAQERGAQRRANVRRLVDLARQFDEMRGEGLYLFLKYVEEQTNAIGDIAPASIASQGAVRLMTIHQSKGLQFPIVAVAGLSKKFNKQDFHGLFLLDEEFGLCARARPPGTRRQYETLAFWLARQRQEKRLLDEEMRLLYVALTRAEQRLLLVGTPPRKAREHWSKPAVKSANSVLDWIGPWLAQDCPKWLEEDAGQAKDWIWKWHGNLVSQSQTQSASSNEIEINAESLAKLRERLEWEYPFKGATEQEAKSSATALRRALADEPELAPPIFRRKSGGLEAGEAGQAAHRFLEHANLKTFTSLETLRAELERLKNAAVLTGPECEAIDLVKALSFWRSDFGQDLLSRPESLRRELIFTARFSKPDLLTVGAPVAAAFGSEEFIVVQGAADLVAVLEKEIWLVDFKTDRLPEKMLAGRVKEYSLQLRIYALALSRIYKRPVTRACLHFLDTGKTVWVDQYQPGYLPLM